MVDVPPPPGLRERKKYETHRALAVAAVELVAERGLDAVTVEDIAATAGVSVRTFFNYFASKEDAVVIAYPDHLERTERAIGRFLAQPAEVSTLDALVTVMREEVADVGANPREWLARMTAVKQNPALFHRAVTMNAQQAEPLTAAIARRAGCDPGDLYPSLLLAVVGGAMNAAMLRWRERGGEETVSALFDEAVASIAAGLPDPQRTR
ncbi:TetR/AcrR family transcriptional regulator [Amycolatopsis sp. NBC_01286]|nr:TetR/AcrR family transcriptional regulator [Amycolatopsis sp. NBC_01286]